MTSNNNKNDNSWRLSWLSFWPDKVILWFKLIEVQFAAKRVTNDEDKFNYVIVMLDEEYIYLAKDILFNRPKKDMYEHLKRKLIKRVNQWRIADSTDNGRMGDRQPSEYFHYLKKVAGSDVKEELLIMLWKNELPSRIKRVVDTIKMASVHELLEVADALYIKEEEINKVEKIKIERKIEAKYRKLTVECERLKRIIKHKKFMRSNTEDGYESDSE